MSYIDSNLLPGEKVVHRTTLHWAIFLKPAFVFAVGVWLIYVAALGGALFFSFGLFLVLGALAIGLHALSQYATAEFGVTSKRVILKQGMISRKTAETLLTKLEGVGVDQGILGRILGYGTITTTGTGGGRTSFRMIRAPMEFRKKVYELLEESTGSP